MQAAVARNSQEVDAAEPIQCIVMPGPTAAQKHKRDMWRYFVLVMALIAVVFLMAIAVYYTQGNSVSIEHVSALARQIPISA